MEMVFLSSLEEYNSLPKNKWNIKQPSSQESIKSIFERGKFILNAGILYIAAVL